MHTPTPTAIAPLGRSGKQLLRPQADLALVME